MSEKATVLISEAKKIKDGSSERGPWTLYSVVDGNEDRYSHFSDSLHSAAKALEGKRAEIEYETSDKGKNLTSLKEAPSENGDAPKLGSGEYITGQKPAIEARRIAAAVAVQEAHNYAELEFKMLNVQREYSPALVEETIDKWLNKLWLWKLRKDETMRDSDIPFMPEYEANE